MLKNLFFSVKNLKSTKVTTKLTLVVFVLAIVSLLVITPLGAKAGVMDALTNVFAQLVQLFVSFIGLLIGLVLSVLINIAQFNEFTNAAAVTTGWVLVRDICNMFFIVILLIISVGTVLGIQSYSYKNFLKKVVIMAILINFSKTIAGFLIDVSQIIMLTFVAAFRDSIVVGFSEAFGLNKLTSLARQMDATGEIEQDNWSLIMGMLLSLVISAILLMVLVSVVVMLAYRIVTLWILIVLSPFAYLASAMPGSLGGQAKQWWKKFSEQLVVGPAIAFFLWLTLAVVSSTGGGFTTEPEGVNPTSVIGGQLASAPFLLNYLLGIMLLIVGMKMAQQMGGSSGAAMGKAFNKAKQYGGNTLKSAGKGARGLVGATAGAGLRKVADKVGAKKGGKRAGSLLHLAAARSKDAKKRRQDARKEAAGKVMRKMGFGEKSFEAADSFAKKGLRKKKQKAKNSAGEEANKKWAAVAPAKVEEYKNLEEERAKNRARKKAETEWKGKSEAEKATTTKKDFIVEQEQAEIKKLNFDNKDTLNRKAKEQYVSQEKSKAVKKVDKNYRAGKLSDFNPLKGAYDYAADQIKSRTAAGDLGRAVVANSGALATGDLMDKKGNAKEGTIKAVINSMSGGELENLSKHWQEQVDFGEEGAEEIRDELALAMKYADENINDPKLKKALSVFSGKTVKQNKKPVKLADAEIKKSKSFMEDVNEEQVLNTATEIENEINYMGTTEVKGKDGEGGYQTNNDEAAQRAAAARNKVALMKDGEKVEVDKDEFIQYNGDTLADHFYDSNRFERLKADKGEDAFTSREDYETYKRIGESSREGITLGSLARDGNMAAVNLQAINERAGKELTGKQRKAGMYVKGDDAVLAASAMTEELDEQMAGLESADSDEEMRTALESFGVEPSAGADLQALKTSTLAKASEAKNNLQNEDKIKEEGLILINKARTGREAKGLIRHEKAHNLIESVDTDGVIQEEVWNYMTDQEKENARQYIREDRQQPDISEEEIKKEYLADALANYYKPGSPDENIPPLPQPYIDRIEHAEEMVLEEDDTGGAEHKSRLQMWREKRAMKGTRKSEEKKVERKKKEYSKQLDLQRAEEEAKESAKTEWSNMDEEEKAEFMAIEGRGEYNSANDAAAYTAFENSFVNQAANSAEKKLQAKQSKLVIKKGNYEEMIDVKNKEQALFAKNYNTNKKRETDLNSRAASFEEEAAQAQAEYQDPSYVNPEGAMARYQEATKKANALRKEANTISTQNEKYKQRYEKNIASIEKAIERKRSGVDRAERNMRSTEEEVQKSKPQAPSAQTTRQSAAQPGQSSGVSQTVESLRRGVTTETFSSEKVKSDLQKLEADVINNSDESDNSDLLEDLRKLLSQVENTSNKNKAQSNTIAGQLDSLLSRIPPEMLNVGKEKVDSPGKSDIGLSQAQNQASAFLGQPLSAEQFLKMKKWIEQQNSQLDRMGQEQSTSNASLTKKISNLKNRLDNIEVGDSDNIDMKVVLNEEGFTDDEIEQVVSDFINQNDTEE